MQRLKELFGYQTAVGNPADTVDFSGGFDPLNGLHRDAIDAKIASLEQAQFERLKRYLIWYVGAMVDTGMVWSNPFGLLVSTAVVAGSYVGWRFSLAADYDKHDQLFHQRINELLNIYHNYLTKEGVKATHDATMLKLVATLSPYVQTESLFPGKGSYPAEFSDQFVYVLSQPPHNIPPNLLKKDYKPPVSVNTSMSQAVVNNGLSLFKENAKIDSAKKILSEGYRAIHAHPAQR